MKITLEGGPVDTYVVRAENGEEILVQRDWNYAGIASTFGWIPCRCSETDGTVDCVHRTVREMLSEAVEFLDEHVGASTEDPGYFE